MRDILTGVLFKLSYSEDPANNIPFGSAVTDFTNIAALPTLTINSQQLDYETYDSEYKTVLLSAMNIQPFDITVNYVPTESSTVFLDQKAKDRTVFQVILNYRQDDGMVDFAIVSGYITATSTTGSKDDVVRKSFRFTPEDEVVSLRSMAALNPVYEGNYGVGSNGATVPQYEPLTPTGNSFIKIPANQVNNPASADMMGVGLIDGNTFSSIAVTKSGALGVYAKNSTTAWTRILTATQIASQYLPLTGGTISGTLTLNNPLAVSSGGTGAKTAPDARTNLGLGTAAVRDIGTSGATVPRLDTVNTWSSTQNLEALTVGASRTGASSIELGSLTTAAASLVDFHSSGSPNDYDARIIATGGTAGSVGRGNLNIQAGNLNFIGTPNFTTAIPITSGGTGATNARDARTTLGFDAMGIGMSSQVPVNAFDWQTADFVSGGKVLVNVSTWLNAPADLKNPSGDVVDITCTMARTGSSRYVVTVTSQATTSNARYTYSVVIFGAKGTRQFSVTQNYNSDLTTIVPIVNGGTGANNAAQAAINLKVVPYNGAVTTAVDINDYGITDAYVGYWQFSTTAGYKSANLPEEAGGILEVIRGGDYGGMQKYTSVTGYVWIRTLTASWNATTKPWGDWKAAGYQASKAYALDLNTLTLPNTYSCNASTLNKPTGVTVGGWCFHYMHAATANYLQVYVTATTSNNPQANRTYQRTFNGTLWTAWAESYTTLNKPSANDVGALPIVAGFSDVDVNTIVTAGVYSCTQVAPNIPAVVTGTMEVLVRQGGLSITQIYHCNSTSTNLQNRHFIRTGTISGNANIWTSWESITSSTQNLTGGTDLNTVTASGRYYGSFVNSPSNVTASALVDVSNTGSNTVILQSLTFATANTNWTRRFVSNTWSNWVQVATSENIGSMALPITGGTLRGALNGTTGTFTGVVQQRENNITYRQLLSRSDAFAPYTGYNRIDQVEGTLPTVQTSIGDISARLTNASGDPWGRTLAGMGMYYDTTGGGSNMVYARNAAGVLTSSITFAGDTGVATMRGALVTNQITATTATFTGAVTVPSLTITNNLPISSGGTGAATAAAGLINLGGVPTTRTVNGKALSANVVLTQADISGTASSGVNSNITSLTGLTTALSIAQGGTAATTAAAALNNLNGMPKTGGTFTGAVTVTGTLGVSGSINQNAVAQGTYCQTALSTGTVAGKNYLRSFRGGNGSTIFHETVQNNTYRIASGTTDTTDALTLSSSGDLVVSNTNAANNLTAWPTGSTTVSGGYMRSIVGLNGNERASTNLQIVKRTDWNYAISRLSVTQVAGGTDTAQGTYFDFTSEGNFNMPGRMSTGAPRPGPWSVAPNQNFSGVYQATTNDTQGNNAIGALSWAYQHAGGYNLRSMWGNVGNGTINWPNTSLTQYGDAGSAGNRYWYFVPTSGDLTCTGDGGFGGSYTFQKAATSDATLKHDINYDDGKASYENIKKLKPCTFVYNFDEDERVRRGIIAQDALREIDSEYVKLVPAPAKFDDEGNRCDEDDTLALDNNVIMMDTALALRYSIEQMEVMKAETDSLKSELAELKALILSQN